MSKLRKLKDTILPKIAASGRFGDRVKFVKCILDNDSSGEAQFASSVCFVTAVFRFRDGQEFEQHLVIKYNMGVEAVRNWLKLDHQFRNEVYVYEKALPFLFKGNENKYKEIFPSYYYGEASEINDPSEYVVVLEDMRSSGFRLSKDILNLDFKHCKVTFEKLGAFHALSFVAKHKTPIEFYSIVNDYVETRLFEDSKEDRDYLYRLTLERAAEPLLKTGEKVKEIQSFKEKLQDSYKYIQNIMSVQEPLGVICHGDFCRNNILYKYENEIPIDVKLFDLATNRYASPMIDFSFFLFLNTSEDNRKLHLNEYLKIYHDSLIKNSCGVPVPPISDFIDEFRKKGVHGYLVCSFFKPAMMDSEPFNPLEEVKKTTEEKAATVLKKGGKEGTEVISKMLREIIDLKFNL